MTPAQEIAKLRDEINEHDYLYYTAAAPRISDREYDKLFARLKELEAAHPELVTPHSPTQRVGEKLLAGFKHVAHAVPMLSIDNTYNEAELREFDGRVSRGLDGAKYEYLVDPKIDGVSASLRYEDGALVLGATRGDGRSGDDITANIKTIRAIPLRLRGRGWPGVLEVRGEVYWPRKAFDAFNAQRVKDGEEPFANPRNATTGALKSLDPRETASRGLAFIAHGFGEIAGATFERASELFAALKQWGVPVSPHQTLCKSIDEVVQFVNDWEARRHSLEYETDGLVIKIDRLDQRDALGATSRFPRWCIAYKYAAEQAESRLLNVDFQVGKLGTITPRAVMEPVQLSGTTVRHASLHNFDQVARLGADHGGLHLGDTVLVEKAGEIIPQVIRITKKGSPRGRLVEPPSKCPVCKGDIEKDEGGVYIRCINPACDAQIKERLKFFCGRDQMDIEGLGDIWIDRLVDLGLIKDAGDLYKLSTRQAELSEIETVKEFGVTKAREFIDSIRESIDHSLPEQLKRLRLRLPTTCLDRCAKNFANIKAFASATEADLIARCGLEPSLASAVMAKLNPPIGDAPKALARLVGTQGLRFKWAGESLISKLVERKWVKGLADFYSLEQHMESIARLEFKSRLGATRAKEIIFNIEVSKNCSLSRLIVALNIPHVGGSTAELLAEHFGSMDALVEAATTTPSPCKGEGRGEGPTPKRAKRSSGRTAAPSLFGESADDDSQTVPPVKSKPPADPLQEIEGIGPEVASSIRRFFAMPSVQEMLDKLRKAGLRMNQELKPVQEHQPLKDKSVVITGSFENYSRNDLEALIKRNGGKCVSAVSKKTSFLLCGNSPGNKLDVARRLGIEVLDLSSFLDMLKR